MVARLLVHLADPVGRDPQAVADAVVAGEVGGRLGGGDQVVAGQPELDRTRELALPHLGAELAAELDRGVHGRRDAGLDPLCFVQFSRHADPQAAQVLGLGDLDRLRQLDGGRVPRVAPGDHGVQEGAIRDGLRDGPDLVERRGERDDPVAGDGAVGRPQADDAAQSGGLLDRAAGVGAERPRREPGRDRRRRAAGGAAGNARGIPGIARRSVGRVLGGRAHRELVHVRLADRAQPARGTALGDGRVVDGLEAFEDLGAGGRLDPARRDHVLERDRDAFSRRVVADAEEAVQLRVALVDRGPVGGEDLLRRRLPRGQERLELLRGQAKRVDHAAGTRK